MKRCRKGGWRREGKKGERENVIKKQTQKEEETMGGMKALEMDR